MKEHDLIRFSTVSSTSDIIVVGAGIVGCAIGDELSRRGASVQIVDERAPGMGATQASAGMLAPYIEAREEGPLLAMTARSLSLFDAFVSDVVARSGHDVVYRRCGSLDVAFQPHPLARFETMAAALERLGVKSQVLDAAGVRREEPQLSEDVTGGLLIPVHGYVAAGQLTTALATAARNQGAQMVEHASVKRVAHQHGELRVETTRGVLTASQVVLAAGSWAGQITLESIPAKPPIRPVRGQLVQVKWTGPPLRRIVWGERCYLVPWEDGTLLIGATVEDAGFDERATVAGVHDLIEAACELVPHAWAAGFSTARVGLRPASPDELPVIGRSAVIPQLMYACGHYRNGVLLAPLTAQLVADAMLDGVIDPMLELTRPSRFGAL
jgi:glycine oxidase